MFTAKEVLLVLLMLAVIVSFAIVAGQAIGHLMAEVMADAGLPS